MHISIMQEFSGTLLEQISFFKITNQPTKGESLTYGAFKYRTKEAKDTTDISAFEKPSRGELKSIWMYKR